MKYARIIPVAVAAVIATALAFGPLAPAAEATLPPGAGCPEAAGGGAILWMVSATLPVGAGQNANGVCINCNGTAGSNNTGALQTNAAACGATAPTVGAGGSHVWADWGATNCVAPGDSVVITFKTRGGSLTTINSITWNLADGSTIAGTGTAKPISVGGLAELPDVASDSSSSTGMYAALAGGLVAAALALTAGAWYARRRWAR